MTATVNILQLNHPLFMIPEISINHQSNQYDLKNDVD